MNRTPLATLLGRLPQILRARYRGGDDALWVVLFNEVLNDIESTMRSPELARTAVVPYHQLGLTNPVPGGLSRVIGARMSDGTPVRITASGTSWVVLDDGLPETSQVIGAGGLYIEGADTRQNRSWITVGDPDAEILGQAGDGVIVTPGQLIDEQPLESWIAPAILRDGSNLLVAQPGEAGENTPWFSRKASLPSISFHLLRTFLAVDGIRLLERATTGSSLSPLSPRWDYVLVDGLEALGEEKTKRASPEARAARAKYEAKKQEMGGWSSSVRSRVTAPRMPSLSLPRSR